MLKSLFAIAAAALLWLAPARAAEMMECDDASMMKVQAGIDKAMADPAMKDKEKAAMEHLDLAKKSKADSKADECKMHLEEANKALM